MKRIATLVENGKVVGVVHGPDLVAQSIQIGSRIWYFDFDKYCGPLWTRKDGTALKNQNPPMTVWNAFNKWLKETKP